MLQIDLRSRVPIYEQLIDHIKRLIREGVLTADEKLPSVRSLAKDLTINPNTIQKAYRELEREGYIYTLQGKGNFVKELEEEDHTKVLKEITLQLKKLIGEALYLGMEEEELYQLIKEIKRNVKGAAKND